jgi:hypothetical protein
MYFLKNIYGKTLKVMILSHLLKLLYDYVNKKFAILK